MSDKHPNVPGPGNLTPVLEHFRSTFPSIVEAKTLKKYNFAPKNESQVLNVLRFLGLIDDKGNRTETGSKIFNLHDDVKFQNEFGALVKECYKDLFDLFGEKSWTLDRNALVTFFRETDQTTAIVGTRQAIVFEVLARYSGKVEKTESTKLVIKTANRQAKQTPKSTHRILKPNVVKKDLGKEGENNNNNSAPPVGLTVRIEVNLPADADQESYDRIFKSIKEHLLNG